MSKGTKKKKQTTWIVKPGEVVMIGDICIHGTSPYIEGHAPQGTQYVSVAAKEFDLFQIIADHFTEVSKMQPTMYMSGGECGLADGGMIVKDGKELHENIEEYVRRLDPKKLYAFLKKHGYLTGGRWHDICTTSGGINMTKQYVMEHAGRTPTKRDITMSQGRPRKKRAQQSKKQS